MPKPSHGFGSTPTPSGGRPTRENRATAPSFGLRQVCLPPGEYHHGQRSQTSSDFDLRIALACLITQAYDLGFEAAGSLT